MMSFLSLRIVFTLTVIVDPDETPHYASFHLDLNHVHWLSKYCKFGNFRENFIFANSIKRHICDINNLRHDLPISVNDNVISPFREDFIFTKLRLCEFSQI